jgi:DNA repair photolyase
MNQNFTINEIECKSIINRSRIPATDYTINPYTGCQHGCVYCYARFMTKYTKHRIQWGRFCDVKINAPEVLSKQITKTKRGLVSLSTVTDPYQAVERKYELTRKILIELATHKFPVSILTKSNLVSRDIDILKRFEKSDCEVGFSIATLDEKVRQNFEPNAPPIKNRIEALKGLHQEGLKTWVFLAPVLPFLTRLTLFHLLSEIKDGVDYILVDTLNIKCGNWQTISRVLSSHYSSFLPKWKDLLFSKEEKGSYYQNIYQSIVEFCDVNNIGVRFC